MDAQLEGLIIALLVKLIIIDINQDHTALVNPVTMIQDLLNASPVITPGKF